MAAKGFSDSLSDVVENATTNTGDSSKKTKKKLLVTLVALAMVVAVSFCIVFSWDKQKSSSHELSVTKSVMSGKSRSLQLQCDLDVSAMVSGFGWIGAQAASAVVESINPEEILTYALISTIIGQPASINLDGVNEFIRSSLVDSSGFITLDLRALNNCVQSLILAPLLLLQQIVVSGLGAGFFVDITPTMLVLSNMMIAAIDVMNSMSIQKIRIGGLDTFSDIYFMKLSKEGEEEMEMASQLSLSQVSLEVDVMSRGLESIPSIVTLKQTWNDITMNIPLLPELISPVAEILQAEGGLETSISIACIAAALLDPQGATVSVAETSGDAISEILGGDFTALPELVQTAYDYVASSLIPSFETCFPGPTNAK